MLNAIAWDSKDTDLEIFCNATPLALGFYCPKHSVGFILSLSTSSDNTILFQESLCIFSAVAWSLTIDPIPNCVLVWSDSLDAVKMFQSLKAT